MTLTINGQARDFDAPLTGAELADGLAYPLAALVAEVNGRIVPRTEFAELRLNDGDVIELVTLVGGG